MPKFQLVTCGSRRFGSTPMMSHGPASRPIPSPQVAAEEGKTVTWLVPAAQVAELETSQQSWLGLKLAAWRRIVPPEVAMGVQVPAAAPDTHPVVWSTAPVGTAARLVPGSFLRPGCPRNVSRANDE